MIPFSSLSLSPALAQGIEVLGHTLMTPVQAQALPPLLQGRDVIAQARTGSGKTIAFALALLSRIDLAQRQVQALVLCPTRELADQVTAELRRVGRFLPNLKIVTLCGGVPVRTQKPALEHAPHVVVGTPGRLLDHLDRQTLTLASLKVLVLDEGDRMLDMGFADAIGTVVRSTPASRQTLLFSATFPAEIRNMSRTLQREAVEITVDTAAVADDLEQLFYEVDASARLDALVAILDHHQSESTLVFCHTRNDTRAVTNQLKALGFSALALHGELEQRERDEVLLRFAHQSCAVLVATDVAARGLDIKGLPLVVSWELPNDPDVHLHRTGRTGRAGKKGVAVSLCAPRERDRAQAIQARSGTKLRWENVPAARPPAPPAMTPMVTFLVDGGRQDKLRPGDLLGALTGDLGLRGEDVGKIDILPQRTYVSARRHAAAKLATGKIKIKGRTFRLSALK